MLKTALMFQDHMILQREKPVTVWGTAAPGAEVLVTVQGQSTRVQAGEDGRWTAKVGPLRASFHETMQISAGEESLTLRDVQVGDVFLAAGQSNMEFHMRYDADLEEERLRCTDDRLRFFDYPEVSYPGQIDEADYGKNFGFWRKANPKQIEWFSAVGYYFAKEIRKRYDVPVGILGCNWGGTPACAWMREEKIREGGGEAWLEDYRKALDKIDLAAYEKNFAKRNGSWGNWRLDPFADPVNEILMKGKTASVFVKKVLDLLLSLAASQSDDGSAPVDPMMGPKYERRPSGLYESMLSEVAPYGIRGILYYQGESDGDGHPEVYQTLFPALISGFRELWGEELPFLFVQLAPFGHWLSCEGTPYTKIRAAQQNTAETVPGTGMAVISDVGMELDIHPKKKQPVGYRLALQAERVIYGEDVLCEAPTLRAVDAEPGRLHLRFENAGTGLYLAAQTPDGVKTDPHRLGGLAITIDGEPVDIEPVRAFARGDTVTITGPDLRPGEICVELGCTGWYRINLYNSAGLPARPARA